MARTVNEIKQAILTQKSLEPELSGLNSTSLVAIWNLWAYIAAVIINVLEQMWDLFRAEVQAKIDASRWGTARWYVEIAKKFQLGDNIEQLPDNQPYSVIDPEKQIVTRASFREGAGVLTLKVAKGDVDNPEALSVGEKSQFEAYINKMKAAGTEVSVVSLEADQLRITASISYDAIYTLIDIQADVEQAIRDFLFIIPFDGVFYKNKLIEAIEDVEGIINVNADTAELRAVQGANNVLVGSTYITEAGYMELDLANSNITYIA
jgi:hypothetical protein